VKIENRVISRRLDRSRGIRIGVRRERMGLAPGPLPRPAVGSAGSGMRSILPDPPIDDPGTLWDRSHQFPFRETAPRARLPHEMSRTLHLLVPGVAWRCGFAVISLLFPGIAGFSVPEAAHPEGVHPYRIIWFIAGWQFRWRRLNRGSWPANFPQRGLSGAPLRGVSKMDGSTPCRRFAGCLCGSPRRCPLR
jgi:hypothetical protein